MTHSPFWRQRIWAGLIDTACCLLPLLLAGPVALFLALSSSAASQFAAIAVFVANLFLCVGITALLQLWTAVLGKPTPGRKRMNLVLLAGDGSPLSTKGRLLRLGLWWTWFLLVLLIGAWPLWALPWLWALADRDGLSLVDRIGRTAIGLRSPAQPDVKQ